MTRIITTGFETGVIADEADAYAGASLSTTTVRHGGYSLELGQGHYLDLSFPAAVAEIYGHFSMRLRAAGAGTYPSTIVIIKDSTGTTLASISVLGSGTTGLRIASDALTANTTLSYSADAWHDVEFHYKCDNAAGIFEIKVDGVTAASIAGDTSPVASGNPAAIRFSYITNQVWWVDDVVVNNTAGGDNNSWPGRVVLWLAQRPDGAGDHTDFTPSAGANWQCVDEVPGSATDYIQSVTDDHYDLYTLTTGTLPAGFVISNVVPVQVACLPNAGSAKITSKVKSDGTEAQGSDHTLSGTYHAYSDAFSVNPNTSAAWDQTDIDNLQEGPMRRAG